MLATMVGDFSGAAAPAKAEARAQVASRATLIRRATRRRFALSFGLAVLFEGGLGYALFLAVGSLGNSDALFDKPIWIDISNASDAAPVNLGGEGKAASRAAPPSTTGQLPSKAKVAQPPPPSPSPAKPVAMPTDSAAANSSPKPIAEPLPAVAGTLYSVQPPVHAAPPPAQASPAATGPADGAAFSPSAFPSPPSKIAAGPSASSPGGSAGSGSTSGGAPHAAGAIGAAGASMKERIASELAAYVEEHKSYPETARMRGVEGTVRLAATIDGSGNMLSVRIIIGSGSRILDEAAEKALRSAFPVANEAMGTLSVELAIRYSLRN